MAFFAAFFVSLAFMVVGELLRPKQKPQDAKPSSLDDFDLPTVSQTRNWPWFAGTCKIDGPNLTWYGDLRTEPIKKKVKTGLFSSTKVTVNNKYYLGAEMFLGIGGDAGIHDVLEVRFNDETTTKVSKSTTADSIVFNFNDPDFFGGNEEGGGVVGTVRIAKGTQTQNANSYLQTVLGRVRSAYRGLCFAVFEGFYWGTRTGIPTVSFVVQRFPNTLGMTGGKHRVGDDANAVCMMYELMTDMKWGGQIATARIDAANWIAIGERLHSEGIGLSMLINNAQTAEEQVKEMLRHIDGVMYEDPDTNKLMLALARDDYDVDTLPLYDESEISSFNFSRGSWSETKNTLMVSFVDRAENYAVRTVPLRNTANIYGRGGVIATESLDFLGFSHSAPATNRGTVALKTLSYPLLSGKLVMNSRRARKLRPGSVIKVNWPAEEIEGIVLRVTRIDYGNPMANRVEIDCLEDIFAVDNASYVVPPPTGWQNPVGAPQPLVVQYAFEAPYQLVGEQARYIATVGSRFSGIDLGYETWQDAAGGVAYANTGRVTEFTPTGVLAAEYSANTDAIDGTGFVVASPREFALLVNATQDELEAGESLALIKSAAGEEIVAWRTVVNNGDGTYTLKNIMRGVYDTVPLTHAAGARVWVLSYGVGLLSETPYGANGTVTGKLLPYNIRGVLPIASATQLSVALTARAWKPYPPANLRINGDAVDTSISGNAEVTWGIRHRVQQTVDGVVVAQDAASYVATPEGGYTVKVYVGGVLKRTVEITAAPFDAFTYTPAMRVEDDADVMKTARIGVTAVNGAYSSIERTTQDFFMLDALDPLIIETTVLPSGKPGEAYNETLVASGGATPYTWSVVNGALPDGLTLSSAGVLSGIPTTNEVASFTVQVMGAAGSTDTQALTLKISADCADYAIPAATGETFDILEIEEALPAIDNTVHICNIITNAPQKDSIESKLLHVYDLTESSGPIVDQHGGLHLSAFGGSEVAYGEDAIRGGGGSAIGFVGVGRAMSSAAPTFLNGVQLWVAAWVRLDTTRLNNGAITHDTASPDSDSTNNIQAYSYVAPDGRLGMFWEYGAGSDENAITVGSLATPGEYFLVFQRVAGEVRFYVDGELFETVPYTNAPTGGTNLNRRLTLGNADAGNRALNGDLQSVMLGAGVLDASEIAWLYAGGQGRNYGDFS